MFSISVEEVESVPGALGANENREGGGFVWRDLRSSGRK